MEPAWSIADRVRRRATRAVDVVSAALDRIEEAQPRLSAFRTVDPSRALDAARAVDRAVARGDDPGPLAGVPLAVKETGESQQVVRLRASGAIVVGRTARPAHAEGMQTLSVGAYGATRNPWAPDRTAGGSSGGSAAVVAAGLTPIATGVDGAGSIRIPAAYCGCVGFKLSRSMTPEPAHDTAARLRSAGPLARNTRDVGRYLDAVVGAPGNSRRPSAGFEDALLRIPRGVAVAFVDDFGTGSPCQPSVAAHARSAVDLLVESGVARADERRLLLPDPGPAWHTLRALDDAVAGAATSAPGGEDVAEAFRVRSLTTTRIDEMLSQVDVIATPTTPTFAHGLTAGQETMHVTYTWSLNLSGHPAVTVPCGIGEDGLPAGLQLVGQQSGDVALLALAAAAESVLRAAGRWLDRPADTPSASISRAGGPAREPARSAVIAR